MLDSGPDRIVWSGALARIGAFRCRVDDPWFHDSGPAQNWCFVFPRTAVRIQHERQAAFAANPNVITFYNRGQSYRRDAISPQGDRCDWFGVHPDLAREAVRACDPEADSRPERPFRLPRAFADAATYLMQRRIFMAVESSGESDALAIEESIVDLLRRVVRCAYRNRASRQPPAPARQNDIAIFVEELLSRRSDEPLQLADIARQAGVSAYHLCRIFKRATGASMHQYRNHIRLRAGLEPVCESAQPVSEIAVASGYYSHSHFTGAFRREFGCTPVTLR
jgi:AraC-like DNA-binding protein